MCKLSGYVNNKKCVDLKSVQLYSQNMLMLAGKEGEREGRTDSECRRCSG